jgi:tetratricopeptide (TPR) repeat protein
MRRRVLGPEHPDTLNSMNNLASDYFSEGKYSQAEALHGETLEIKRRVLGPEHPITLVSMRNLAMAYKAQGKYAQAEALIDQTLQMRRRVLGPEHPESLSTLSRVAFLYQREGKYELAETYAAQAVAGRRHTLGSEHTDTMASAADLALAYLSQGKFGESEPLAREAVEFGRKKRPEDWQRFRAEGLLGASLAGQKKYAEAEPLLLSGYEGLKLRESRIPPAGKPRIGETLQRLVHLYEATGRAAQLMEWKERLAEFNQPTTPKAQAQTK